MFAEHDKSVIDRDAALRGLRFLLDAGSLREALADRLDPEALAGLSVGYLRYKPGVNCIARLDLDSGFAYAKAFAPGAVSKLAKERKRPAIEGDAGVGKVIVDELDLMVSFFPNDARLPSIADLADPERRAPFLERVFKKAPGWAQAEYSPLNYKPERRFVARLTRDDGEAASIKFYCTKEFGSIRRSRKKFNLPPGLRVPRWIGGSKNHRVMVHSWLPGETLHSRLESDHCEEAHCAGEAIARLHLSSQPALGKRRPRNLTAVLNALGVQLKHLLPDVGEQADDLIRRFEIWQRNRESRSCPVHGDFYDKQVIIGTDAVGIIDSDRVHLGDPETDLGCFLAHLERRRIDGVLDDVQVKRTRSALLEGYRAVAPAAQQPRDLEMHTAVNLFRLSHHAFRDRRSNWAGQTTTLLDRCATLVGEHE